MARQTSSYAGTAVGVSIFIPFESKILLPLPAYKTHLFVREKQPQKLGCVSQRGSFWRFWTTSEGLVCGCNLYNCDNFCDSGWESVLAVNDFEAKPSSWSPSPSFHCKRKLPEGDTHKGKFSLFSRKGSQELVKVRFACGGPIMVQECMGKLKVCWQVSLGCGWIVKTWCVLRT